MVELKLMVIKWVTMPVKIDQIIRSKRRSISIQVREDCSLVVRAPNRVPLVVIQGFVNSKEKWILGQKNKAQSQRIPAHQFKEGESFPFLGKSFLLTLVDFQNEKLLFNEGFFLRKKDQVEARHAFTQWYQSQARRVFQERVSIHAAKMVLPIPPLRLSSARTRWGSCSPSGGISLTWRLVMAPVEVIDYVIIHELAHLKINNHSKAFWERVRVYDPHYLQNRKWLKRFGYLLSF